MEDKYKTGENGKIERMRERRRENKYRERREEERERKKNCYCLECCWF
jgi:hypothetical protein